MCLTPLKQCIFLEQNLSHLQVSGKYLAYNKISRLPYLGMNSAIFYLLMAASDWWLLPSLGQVWLLLEWIGYQKKETTTFGLNNTFIKIMLNACFCGAFHCLMQILSCVFLLPNTCTASATPIAPLQFSYAWSIFLWKKSCFNPESTLKNLYLPNGVQKVVMSDYAASFFTFQYPCFASDYKNCRTT